MLVAMPVELRKRKAAPPAPEPAPKRKASVPKASKAAAKVKEAVTSKSAAKETVASKKPAVGDLITPDGFGGEVETNDGTKTSLKALLDESKTGVVLFTYPKASTPGCKFPPRSFLYCHLLFYPQKRIGLYGVQLLMRYRHDASVSLPRLL